MGLLLATAEAFQAPVMRAATPTLSRSSSVKATVFDQGMNQFAADFPWLAKNGFGPSVKAERWNGRHAMFGWFMILLSGYMKSHGLFPSADTTLAYKDWGGLAQIGFGQYISNERAIIMIAHIHALAVSACAAWGPQILGDSLTLLDGEEDVERPPCDAGYHRRGAVERGVGQGHPRGHRRWHRRFVPERQVERWRPRKKMLSALAWAVPPQILGIDVPYIRTAACVPFLLAGSCRPFVVV